MRGSFGKRARRKTRDAGSTPVRAGNGSMAEFIPFTAFSSDSFEGSEDALLLVMHASAMVRIHHPRSVSSLVSFLWVVSEQLLRTGSPSGQDVR